jgi:outer membrane protein
MKKYLAMLFMIISLHPRLFGQELLYLTLDDCIKRGINNSKELVSRNSQIKIDQAKLTQVNANRLPQLSFSGSYARLSEVPSFVINIPGIIENMTFMESITNSYQAKLTLRQPLFTGFSLESSTDAADYNIEATKAEFETAKSGLVLGIQEAYWNYFKALKYKKLIDENGLLVRTHVHDIENYYNQGLVMKNDLLKVKVEYSNIQLQHIEINNNVKIARYSLNNKIGFPIEKEIEIDTVVKSALDDKRIIDGYVYKALSKRPEIKKYENLLKASKSMITSSKSGWYPKLYLFSDYIYANPNERIYPTKKEFNNTWDIGVSISVNIWDWFSTKAETEKAEATYEQINSALSMMKDGISLQVNSYYLDFIKSKEKIEVCEKSVGQAEENYNVTYRRFKEGVMYNTDLLDAEVSLLNSKTNLTNALVDNQLAKARLLNSIGE